MLKKTVKILLFGLFLSIQTGIAHADQKWVAISVNNGKDAASEYDGLIDSAILDQMTKNPDSNAMILVSSVCWMGTDGKIAEMKNYHPSGINYGYTDTMYFREDTITRFVLLDKGYIEGLLPKT